MTGNEHERDLLDVMERRRDEAARFTWAVPAVAVASQAFLMTIALDGGADPARRLIASAAAFVTLLGAIHLFRKQAFGFALYEAVIKRERRRLKLSLVDRNSLLVHTNTLEGRFQEEWMARREGKLVWRNGYYQPRWEIRWRAIHVWYVLFLIFGVLDLGLGIWALYDGFDTGWFGGTSSDRRRFDED